jgi:hypothetical protein
VPLDGFARCRKLPVQSPMLETISAESGL